MEHEHPSTPERREEVPPTGIFNLDKLPPKYLMSLIEALCEAASPKEDLHAGDKKAGQVNWIVEQDLEVLAKTSPEKAQEFYDAITADGVNWSKQVAVDVLAEPLAQHYTEIGQTDKRRAVIERWVSLLDDENEEVREAVEHSLTMLLEDEPEWLDEPTAWEIVGEMKLREESRRD
jgi:hypothetical protein